jgi:hypothetical protein
MAARGVPGCRFAQPRANVCDPVGIGGWLHAVSRGVAMLNPRLMSLIPLGSVDVLITIPEGSQKLAQGRRPRVSRAKNIRTPAGC